MLTAFMKAGRIGNAPFFNREGGTMKPGIIITAFGMLAVALFAAPDVHSWWYKGPDVAFDFWGSSTAVDVDPDTGATTTNQNSITRGKRQPAFFNSEVIYDELGPYEGCPVVGADVTATFVAIYRDGSILTGSGSGSACFDGAVFEGSVAGPLTGTVGRFEGVTGTWEADASVENSAFVGSLTADFD